MSKSLSDIKTDLVWTIYHYSCIPIYEEVEVRMLRLEVGNKNILLIHEDGTIGLINGWHNAPDMQTITAQEATKLIRLQYFQ